MQGTHLTPEPASSTRSWKEEAVSNSPVTDRVFPIGAAHTTGAICPPPTDTTSALRLQARQFLVPNPFEQALSGFEPSLKPASGNDQVYADGTLSEGQLGTFETKGTFEDTTIAPESTAETTPVIQRHGLLLVLEVADDPRVLLVQAVSENSDDIILRSPHELFALRSFTDIFSDDQADILIEHIHLLRSNSGYSAASASDVFTLSLEDGQKPTLQLLCALHQCLTTSRSIICDIEVKQEQIVPNISSTLPRMASGSADKSVDKPRSPGSAMSSDERTNTVTSAPKRTRRKLDSVEILRTMSQVQDRLVMASDMIQLVDTIASIAKEVTGSDRVLVCQHDRRGFGRVVAEVAATNVPVPLYHGLRFRSTEASGRREDAHEADKVSVLYNRDTVTSLLLHRPDGNPLKPIDLAHSFLRIAPSIRPLHVDDLDVQSAVSISVNGSGGLWGVIECYSSTSCEERISFLTRKLCSLIGDAAWANLQRVSAESRLKAWKMVQTMRLGTEPTTYKLASTRQLLNHFRADSGFLLAGEQVEAFGRLEHPHEALMILRYLAMRDIISVIASTDLRTDFPDLEYPLGFDGISGILVVPLCLGGNEFMVFLRDAKLKELNWAGNPYNPLAHHRSQGNGRRGFKPWRELTTEMGEEWSEDEIETATVLCLLSEKAKKALKPEQSLLRSDMVAQLLLKNSAHELRTPLNAIVNFLEIARNDTLGPEIREQLDKSHIATQSLVQAIDDMLCVDDDRPEYRSAGVSGGET